MKQRILLSIASVLLVIGVLPLLFPAIRQGPYYLELLVKSPPSSLPVPVEGVRRSQLSDTWGAPRSGGRKHEGIDIFARRNTPVLSATDGVLSEKGWNDLGGRVMVVTGPGGHHHYYAHLERFSNHEVGTKVRRGEVIGYVGDSGNAKGTPTHLHYGIYTFDGTPYNPYPLLARAPAAHAISK